MAIFDQATLLSDAQAITADAASTNYMDFRASGAWVHSNGTPTTDDKGVGCLPIAIQVVEDFATLTSLEIQYQMDDNSSFSSPTTVHSETILLADLVAGKKTYVREVPFGTTDRYFRLNYNVNGSNATAGKITAGIGTMLESPFGKAR